MNNFKKSVSDVKTLVMMQLKNKLDLSFFHNKKKTFLKLSLMALGLVALTVVFYFVFYLATVFRFFSFGFLLPISVLNVILTVFLILSTIVNSFGLMQSLFFSNDNQFLLTMPVERTKIFVSKLIVYYLNELLKNIIFVIPLLIAFGLVNKLPFYFFIWMIFCVFFVAAVPVALGAFLSMPLMLVFTIFKQNRVVEITAVVAVIGVAAFVIVKLIQIIPENINIIGTWRSLYWDIQTFLEYFTKYMFPFTCITSMIVGKQVNLSSVVFTSNTPLYFFGLLLGLLIIFGISFLIARPMFFKMASKPFEYRKRQIKKVYKNKKMSPFKSNIKKEALQLFRTPEKLYSLLFVGLLMPIAILFLNKIFAAMSVRLVGTYMTIAFNILIMLLILLSSNANLAKTFSEEGNAHYLYKTNPQKYWVLLLPKLLLQFVIMTISLIATINVFAAFSNISNINLVVLFFLCWFLYIAHLFWSAEFDIMSPHYDQYQTTGQGNANENKSVFMAFLISFVVTLFTFMLINENSQTIYIKIAVVALLFMIFRIYMFFEKVKLYYRQPYGEER